MPSRSLYALLLCVLVTSVPAPADILPFSDTTFYPVNYNFSNPPVVTTGGVTQYSYGQCAACGNPAYGFEASITTDGAGGAFVGFLNNTFVYNPQTQGAINYIDTSVDKNLIVSPSGDFTSNYYPIIEQGGYFYIVEILGPVLSGTQTGYVNIKSQTDNPNGLTATSFGLFDFAAQTLDTSSHPDFSTGGAQITLGLAPLISANYSSTITADYDNLLFDINYTPITPSPVPESSSLGLLSIFLMGLFLRGLRPAIRWRLKRR